MIKDKSIHIRNIYYMLAYAFKVLESHGFEKLTHESFENAADLLSAILAKGVELQIKRGLGRAYVSESESLSTLCGKIDIANSIKMQTMLKKQLVCNYDEFSVNTKFNQIIKTTIEVLLRADIKNEHKKLLKNLLMYFKDIDTLNPYVIEWNMRFNRNDAGYQMLMGICYLIIKGLLQKDEQGDMRLQKFLDEQKMHKIYEKFVLEYYRKHFSQLKVSSSQISWQLDKNNDFLQILPTMQADIMLCDGQKTLIIDTKYYSKTMQQNQYDKKSLHSNNLYQIFTYVKNHDIENNGSVAGMLLYAKTDEAVTPDAKFNMCGSDIFVKTLDLNVEFEQIQKQLGSIVESIFASPKTYVDMLN